MKEVNRPPVFADMSDQIITWYIPEDELATPAENHHQLSARV